MFTLKAKIARKRSLNNLSNECKFVMFRDDFVVKKRFLTSAVVFSIFPAKNSNNRADRFFVNLQRRKVMIYFCQKGKNNGGSPTSFWKEHVPKNTLNLKNQA